MRYRRIATRLVEWMVKLDEADLPGLSLVSPKLKRQLARTVYGQLQASVADEPLKIDGLKFYSPGTLSQRVTVMTGNVSLRALWPRHLKPGMKALDVGANVGYHTIAMADAVGKSGKVYAVEPVGANIEVLTKNKDLNGFENIVILPFAAGAKQEWRDLYIRNSSYFGQNNSLYLEYNDAIATLNRVETVQVIPLDQLVNDDIDVAKIDVEGAELEALQGMTRILENPSITLVIEWHPILQVAAGHDALDLPRFLLDTGFSLYDAHQSGESSLPLSQLNEIAAEMLADPRHPIVDFLAYRRM